MPQHRRKQVDLRMKRIHGHVNAITRILDEGRSYSEIVHQVSAVRAALDGVVQVIVEDLVEDCVSKMERKQPVRATLIELEAVVANTLSSPHKVKLLVGTRIGGDGQRRPMYLAENELEFQFGFV